MESWFDVWFRIPFTSYWVAWDLRVEGKKTLMLARKMFDSKIGYYFEAV